MTSDNQERFLRFLGLCRKAGKTVCGTPLVCTALGARRKPFLVIGSDAASPATRKRLTTKCAYYRVPLFFVSVPPDELAHAVGKTGMLTAVGIMDENFAREISNINALGKELFASAENR